MCRRRLGGWFSPEDPGGRGMRRRWLLRGKRGAGVDAGRGKPRPLQGMSRSCIALIVLISIAGFSSGSALVCADAAQKPVADNSPEVTKVEPPNWWIGLTPEVMLLLSGRGLEATKVECNLPSILVERTQATAGGTYLFVWLKFGADIKSGTAVCRITAPTGVASFELPLAARTETIHKFKGLTTNDAIYLIMPDRFANGDPTNDEPGEARGSHDRSKARAYHGGDLRGIREHLPYLKDLGVT